MQHGNCYCDGSRLLAPRTVGANKVTGKEVSVQFSRRGLMTDLGKTSRETRNPDAALQNSVQTLRFASANIGTLVGRSGEVVDMLNRRMVEVVDCRRCAIGMAE